MLNEKNVLGKSFRKLRESKKMSISATSDQITSRSSLQRWENGEGEMSVEKVVKLLKRIHIQPQEYIDIVGMSSFELCMLELKSVYQVNDVKTLRELAKTLLKKHFESPQNVQLLFTAAIACNFYYDLSNKDLFPSREKIRLESYLSSIKDWTRENVIYFANIQLYLTSDKIYLLSQDLYSYLTEQSDTNKFYIMSVNALLNSVFALIKKGSLDAAANLLKRLRLLDLPIEHSDAKIRLEFMKKLLDCIYNRDTSPIINFIKDLNKIGLKKSADNYEYTFYQISELYHLDS